MSDVVIVGGGVIGLTCAYELARDGCCVTVVDQGEIGRAASWAGAGMIPPGGRQGEPVALRQLANHAAARWPVLSLELHALTGRDNEYSECGSYHFPLPDSNAEWDAEISEWASVPHKRLSDDDVKTALPHVGASQKQALYLPTAAQVRNPRHLQALRAACEHYGVTFIEHDEVLGFCSTGQKVESVTTRSGRRAGEQFLVTSGAWTTQLLAQLTDAIAIEPVRGQIALLRLSEPLFTHLLECGPRYLVPRRDGQILIGSTEEWAGFDPSTTSEGIEGLLEFAFGLVPELQNAELVQTWAGLRPYSNRSLPYVGPVPFWKNLWVAAGHFRAGLSLSPATALVVKDMLQHRAVPAEMAEFSVQ